MNKGDSVESLQKQMINLSCWMVTIQGIIGSEDGTTLEEMSVKVGESLKLIVAAQIRNNCKHYINWAISTHSSLLTQITICPSL